LAALSASRTGALARARHAAVGTFHLTRARSSSFRTLDCALSRSHDALCPHLSPRPSVATKDDGIRILCTEHTVTTTEYLCKAPRTSPSARRTPRRPGIEAVPQQQPSRLGQDRPIIGMPGLGLLVVLIPVLAAPVLPPALPNCQVVTTPGR
jgi:hypothetical protein